MQRNEEGIVNNVFSETGDAANPAFYSEGFTPAMSTPGSGQFPPRTAFNFLFKILTALAVDVNSSGCFLPWDVLVNYYQGARVVGTDDKVYVATTNNGPATGNAANPAQTPVPAVWQLSPEYSFGTMATQNANDVTISGGNITDTNFGGGQIDSTPIGLNTPDAAAFTKAIDNGVSPTLPAQLTNKAYVDATAAGTKTVNSNGTCLQLPGGLKIQIIPVTFPASNDDIVQTNVTFPVPFTSINYFAIPSGTQPLNSSSDPSTGSGIPVVRDATLTGLTAILDTNGYLTNIDNTTTGVILAVGFKMTQILPNLLLNNVSSDSSGTQITIPESGWRVIKIDGNLGGGGITLQTKGNSNDSEFLDVPDPVTPSNPFTVLQATQFRVYLGAGMILQATLSASVGASGVYARIF